MKQNKLLTKQLKKFLPEEWRNKDEFKAFIEAINNSYNAYEKDIELSERAFRLTEEEYRALNDQLTQEVNFKKEPIKKLKEAIADIGEDALIESDDENELLSIASLLKKQIDIQRETEVKLNYQKQFYEQILNFIPADIVVYDKNRRYLFLNPKAVRKDEVREWMIGKTDEEYCTYRNKDESIAATRRKLFEDTVSSGEQKEWEENFKTSKGKTEYFLRKMHPVFDKNNQLDIVIGYGVNITELKKIEEQIRLSEVRYKSIFDNSQALICTHDLDGILLEANKASIATFGYKKEEMIGFPLSMLLPAERQVEFDNFYLTEIRARGKAEGIMVAVNRWGKKIFLLYQNFLVSNGTEPPYVIGFSQDITARKEAEMALKKSEEKYRSIIENMNLGLLQVNTEENIVYANQSFCDMSGHSLEDLIDKNALALFSREKSITGNERAGKGKTDAWEQQVKDKNGAIKWWLISTAPVTANDGEFGGTIGIYLDITLHKKLEQELRSAKSEAEHSSHAKEAFLANMSHEIRTPMNAIIGIGNLLGKTQMETQQRNYLEIIQKASNNLLVIINDLLDFSKIEAGKISLENIGFDLKGVVENATHILKHKAEEKGLLLTCWQSHDIEPVLIGDPYRLNQVLINLVSNAIKFTERGGVRVNCSVVESDDTSQKILFQVIDTGIGISEEFLDRLFEKFTQEAESVARQYGGTGLGMSISKQLIELMEGDIQVDSRKNAGTTISFSISFSIGTAADLPDAGTEKVDTQILKGKHILLVEDNPLNRILATTILRQYGADVDEAENGEIAIEKTGSGNYDLILMDVRMPVKNGLEATEYIRHAIDSNIPIIALTANAFKEEKERCLAAGMNDFISKPFEEEKMIQLIAQWLGREIKITASPVKENEPVSEDQLYDLNLLTNIARGDASFVTKALKLFVEEVPVSLEKMEQASLERDWETLAAAAHHIRPSFINFGILSIKEELETLEYLAAKPREPIEVWHVMVKIKSVIDQLIREFQALLDERVQ
jgi:PAS domain S-box-containing protein